MSRLKIPTTESRMREKIRKNKQGLVELVLAGEHR